MKIPEERRQAIETAILEAVARGAKHGEVGNGLLRSVRDRHPQFSREDVSRTAAALIREGKLETSRAAQKPKDDNATLRSYQRTLRKLLPYKVRAKRLAELAKDDDARIAMKALQLIDNLEGLLSQAKDNAGQPAPGPMFMLPEGTTFEIDAPTPAHIDPLAFEAGRQQANATEATEQPQQQPQAATA